MRRWVIAGVVVAVVVALTTVWFTRSRDAAPPRYRASTTNYLPGVAADLFVPRGVRQAPVVVLIPGGGWVTADRSGLRPLAGRLAAHGIFAVTATYRAADDGVRFPVPVADVECAIDFAVAHSRQAGITPGPVLVFGHSAGAHLVMLAALTGQRFRAGCPYSPARVDGVIGVAGPYDIRLFQYIAQPLLGESPAVDPSGWRQANPVTWVRNRPDMPVLLVHGADDTTVPPTFTTSFADRLRKAGHPVRVEIVPGADHASTYRAEVVGDRILAWIDARR